jgi:hypothetical protein
MLNGFRKRGDNLWDIVRGCHKVDVMTAKLLESDHHPCHVRGGDSFTPSKMTDIVVLAENTTEVAVGEKEGP